LAVAHLHSPYATLFAIAKRKFQPVTLQGSMFLDGIPLYPGAHLITTPALGQEVANLMGSKRATLLRSHGIVVVGRDIEEMLYGALVFEDNALKAVQAATLGELQFLTAEESQAHEEGNSVQYRARRAWHYFTQMEARWDRQQATGLSPYV
jgi:ribulose-5-phosphate 4-epimerase/fuculose-1-phosphate aldolase